MPCSRCTTPVVVGSASCRSVTAELCGPCCEAVEATITSTPTMRPEAMTTPFPVVSRGKTFKVYSCPQMWHPSWWSFMDEQETREAWWHVEPNDIVADVGADFGSYTLSALAQGAAGVIAWSPPFKDPSVPVEGMTLARSGSLNGWNDRLRVFGSGLWSKPGWLAAFDGPRLARWFATQEEAKRHIKGQSGHVATFPVDTLDNLGLKALNWLKIDTEGAEMEILAGAEATLKRLKPRILLEHHYHLDPKCEQKCDGFLDRLGYEKVGTRPHGSIAHSLYVPKALMPSE